MTGEMGKAEHPTQGPKHILFAVRRALDVVPQVDDTLIGDIFDVFISQDLEDVIFETVSIIVEGDILDLFF